MTHEIKNIIQGYLNATHLGLSCVMATVVDLDGSSYRRPGVRMLITEHGQMTGAVSGGCVEKEILKQAHSVFETGGAKMMTYDGRYRLGCEGTLYILIEKFKPSAEMLNTFQHCIETRNSFEIVSRFSRREGTQPELGSEILFQEDQRFGFQETTSHIKTSVSEIKLFRQVLKPCFRLVLVGAEHDAAQLSIMAASLGWEVVVIVSPSDPQSLTDFPGAMKLLKINASEFSIQDINDETALVLMSHSYVKDLNYLMELCATKPSYIGLLGPSNRRERMLNDLIEKFPDIDESFFDRIFGPAGLNIGAETPQEIALSICSEILSVIRKEQPKSLKDKLGRIHLNTRL